jgi:amidohydrolase
MIKAGVLQDVTAAYAVHVDPTLSVGKYGLIKGAATAAADRFEIVVSGPSSGHSARPHQAIDTIWVATQIAQHLYQLVGRITDSRNAAILTICRFEGGSAFNVIPRAVAFGGTLRCTVHADRRRLKQALIDTAQQIGTLHHARIEVNYMDGAPPVVNDAALVDEATEVIARVHGYNAIVNIPAPSMGAEDFAYYLESVPGVLIRVGTASSPETSYPLHDSLFDIDERALAPAVELVSEILIARLDALAPS